MNYSLLDINWFAKHQKMLKLFLNLPLVGWILKGYINIPKGKVAGILPNCIHYRIGNGKLRYHGYTSPVIAKTIMTKFYWIFWLIHMLDVPIDKWAPEFSFGFDSFFGQPLRQCGVGEISCDVKIVSSPAIPIAMNFEALRRYPEYNNKRTQLTMDCSSDLKVMVKVSNMSLGWFEHLSRSLISFDTTSVKAIPGSVTNRRLALFTKERYNQLDDDPESGYHGQNLYVAEWKLDDYLVNHHATYGNPIHYIFDKPSLDDPDINAVKGDWGNYNYAELEAIIDYSFLIPNQHAITSFRPHSDAQITSDIPSAFVLMLQWDWDWNNADFSTTTGAQSGFVFGSSESPGEEPYMTFDYTPELPAPTNTKKIIMIV